MADAPPTILGVLRAALGLVRRRLLLFTILAVVLTILPDLIADAAVDLDDPAVLAALGGPDGAVADLLAAIIDGLEDALPHVLALVFDAVVIAVALRDAGAPSGLARSARILLPLVVAAYLLDTAWNELGPPRAAGVGSALISCWIFVAPVWAAERPRLVALPQRSAALMRDHRGLVATIVIAYLAAYVVLAKLDARLLSGIASGTAADRTASVFGGAAQAALSVVADAAAVALYLALRRAERPSPATLAAFE